MDARIDQQALPPGSPLPQGPQTTRWVMQPLTFLQELRERHGDVFTIHLADVDPWVVVSDPELVKQVFTAPPDVLSSVGGHKALTSFFGADATILLDGERHTQRRRMLSPRLRGDHVKRYEATIRETVEEELDRWPTGQEEGAWPHMRAITLRVIMRVVFGERAEDHVERLREAVADLRTHPKAADERGAASDPDAAVEHANDLIVAEVRRRRNGATAPGPADDILSTLLEATYEDGSPLSDDDIRDDLLMLLIAGHETAATSLTWALERLARNPAAQARATSEAHAGGGPYTDAVIQETLRLRPALPLIARQVAQPFQLGDHLLPPGTTIVVGTLLVHHRADIYPDPGDFRPERFLERPPGTYTWIPFGGGVRRCIGAGVAMFEMRVILATLLSRMSIRAATTDGEAMRKGVTLMPTRGGQVTLEARATQAGVTPASPSAAGR